MTDWEDPGDGSPADRLSLADWRRRVTALYGEVRAMAATDPAIALAHWRAVREQLFREHPQSPVPVAERAGVPGTSLRPRPAAAVPRRRRAGAATRPGALALALPNSGDDTLSFARIGRVRLPFPGWRACSSPCSGSRATRVACSSRSGTRRNGTETYGAGRYLVDAAKGADLGADAGPEPGTWALILDFNFATQPSCAFDPSWACPLAPPENRLDLEVRAGERLT